MDRTALAAILVIIAPCDLLLFKTTFTYRMPE
jgi:hypothetical protein